MVTQHPEIANRYKYILVDEFQDTNGVQSMLIENIKTAKNDQPAKLFIVGDLKQSIYRFRHANLEIFADYIKRAQEGAGRYVYLSDIDAWAQCPALYAYKSILNLYQPKEAGFDPQRCGILFHQLWQKAWSKRLTYKDSSLEACIEEVWEQTVKSVYPSLLSNKKLFRHNERLYAQAKRLALIQEGIKSNLGNFSISQYWEVELPTVLVDAVSFAVSYTHLSLFWPQRETEKPCRFSQGIF